MPTGIARYKRAQQDVAPEQLVTLLLRTAVARLSRLEALERPDERWVTDVHHVRCILIELREALDPEVDAALVQRLGELYSWCLLELVKAGADHRTVITTPVRRVLDHILEGWTAAVDSTRQPEAV